jgi:hypothetical protein
MRMEREIETKNQLNLFNPCLGMLRVCCWGWNGALWAGMWKTIKWK